jgi:WD40 repeat protein
MTGSRARRVKDLFDRALDAEPPERGRLLEGQCGRETREEVERLLDAHARAEGFLERPAAEALRLEPGTRVGRYAVVRPLAAGGAGTVYEALQDDPPRRVALKVMSLGPMSAASIQRFRDEAAILARLRHPGIATVFDAGLHEGVPYFALEYVEGARPITEHASGLDRRARAALFAKVCDAVHHGHEHGIVHRDLKPDNVLVDAAGEPRVIDFGIARAVGEAGGREVSGTLPYMSPEQCDPDSPSADARVDVYALGVLLYELLSGQLPFDLAGLSTAEALRRIREARAVPLSARDRRLRGDLEAIVGKAMAPSRERRYASAAALADDVRRHLALRPVEARPATLLYVAGRFARRRHGTFLGLVAVAAALVAATVVSAAFAVQKARAQRQAEYEAYLANVSAAASALEVNAVSEARQRLDDAPAALRGWEWRHLRGRLDRSVRTLVPAEGGLYRGTVSDDGSRIAAVFHAPPEARAWDGGGEPLWRLPTPQVVRALALSRDGRLLALALWSGAVEIRDGGTGAVLRSTASQGTFVNALAFDRESRLLLTGSEDSRIRLWDVADGTLRATLADHADRVLALAFSAAGDLLASGSRDGTVHVRETKGWTPRRTIRASHTVESLAFSPDGRRIVWGSRDQTARLWDLEEEREVAAMAGHQGNVREARFSPDGRRIVTAGEDRTARLWDGGSGHAAGVLRGHGQPVFSAGFLPDGQVVSFAYHGEAKVWAPDAHEEVLTLRGHEDAILGVAFLDGTRLVSLSNDGEMRVWDAAKGREIARARREGIGRPPALAAAAGRIYAARRGGGLAEYEAQGLLSIGLDPAEGRVAVAAAGRYLAFTRGRDLVWREIGQGSGGTRDIGRRYVCALAVSEMRGDVAIGFEEAGIEVRAARTLDEIAAEPAPVRSLAFAWDGRLLAAGLLQGEALLLDPRSLAVRARLPGHALAVTALAFSPDGSRLATASADGIRLWDTATARPVLFLMTPDNPVLSLAWSPDGARLASGHGKSLESPSVVRVWEGR